MQGQDIPGARVSVALRLQSRKLSDVDKAFNKGDIVRSWPMRGTAHFVPAKDLGWMLSLTAERTLKAVLKRHAKGGREIALYDKVEKVTRELLQGNKQVSREALGDHWRSAGVVEEPHDIYQNIFVMSQRLVLVQGPGERAQQNFVLYDEWVKKPHKLERDEALAEWALRYFDSHGPAPLKDFAWWTKLPAADVKSAVASVRDQLAVIDVDDVEYFMAPDLPDRLKAHKKAASEPLLLPGFDEFVLGYGNRDPFVDPVHAGKLVPGNNGMFKASIVHKGQVVGTWKHKGTGAKRILDHSMWEIEAPKALSKTYELLPR